MSDEDQDRPFKKVKVEETITKEEEDIKSEPANESTCLTNDKGESYFPIGDKRRCTIRKWKQTILIDIREFYEKGGEELPGRKGISLSQTDYEKIHGFIADGKIEDHIKALQTHNNDHIVNNGDFTVNEEGEIVFDVSSNKKLTIRKWNGTIYTDIREFYEKNGKSLPGKKGISLSVMEFEQLKDVNDEIFNMVASLGGKKVKKKETTVSNVKAEPTTTENMKAEESDTKSDFLKNDNGESYLELSSTRRCTIRKWKGKVLFDVREFYEKNDKFLPGKKGISLSEEQYSSFRESIDKIKNQIQSLEGGQTNNDEDLKTNDEGDVYFELSSDKRCTVRQWKNKTLIDIRQTYEKNGKVLPGRQGISLSKEQYETLHNAIKGGSVDKQIQSL